MAGVSGALATAVVVVFNNYLAPVLGLPSLPETAVVTLTGVLAYFIAFVLPPSEKEGLVIPPVREIKEPPTEESLTVSEDKSK